MKTDSSEVLKLLNNELKVMIAFNDEFDFMQLKKDNCWYQNEISFFDYSVKIKMDRMDSDLKMAMKSSDLKHRGIWKIDTMFKIAITLKKMHDADALHLDLKEQNIMMMNKYTPVIADFGFSLLPGQKRNFLTGSPLFMGPEINKNRKYVKETDIFALGIIFF